MNSYEVLFAELNEIRLCAPDDARLLKRVSPQLDPVRVLQTLLLVPLCPACHPARHLKYCRNLFVNIGTSSGTF